MHRSLSAHASFFFPRCKTSRADADLRQGGGNSPKLAGSSCSTARASPSPSPSPDCWGRVPRSGCASWTLASSGTSIADSPASDSSDSACLNKNDKKKIPCSRVSRVSHSHRPRRRGGVVVERPVRSVTAASSELTLHLQVHDMASGSAGGTGSAAGSMRGILACRRFLSACRKQDAPEGSFRCQ